MTTVTHSPEAATCRRFTASEPERRRTHELLETGHVVEANTLATVEHRKDRLLAEPGVAVGIPVEQRVVLETVTVADAPDEARAAFERQIGGNQTQPAWFLERGTKIRRTVGRIHIRDASRRIGWATGFLIESGLLLTNAHVLDSFRTARHSRVEFDWEENYDGDMLPSAIFDLDPATLFVSNPAAGEGLDFALVAVAPTARASSQRPIAELAEFGYNVLEADPGMMLKGESINIVHHPQGAPRQVSLRENRLMALDSPALQGIWMHYETDTDAGSSGAPLYNDQWEVVGIHHRAVEKRDESGNILTASGQPWTRDMGDRAKWWHANEGLRIGGFLANLTAQLRDHRTTAAAVGTDRVITTRGEALVEALLAG